MAQYAPPIWSSETTVVDEVIYRVSHDLQAPVRAMRTIPHWIEEDLTAAGVTVPDDVRGHLDLLHSEGKRLQYMIMDLLTYSRVGRSTENFTGDWDALWQVVARNVAEIEDFDIIKDIQTSPAMKTDDLRILLQVLIGNAIRHHHDRTGKIKVSVVPENGMVCITVTDDGPGIPKQHREEARGMMKSLSALDKAGGSGMGLPIAIKVCETYGGTLEIDDAPDGPGCQIRSHLAIDPIVTNLDDVRAKRSGS